MKNNKLKLGKKGKKLFKVYALGVCAFAVCI